MIPSPELFGIQLNWFDLITVISILITLLFGRWYFFYAQKEKLSIKLVLSITVLLISGYVCTFLMASFEGAVYAHELGDEKFKVAFGTSKRFSGFIFLIAFLYIFHSLIKPIPLFKNYGDFLAVVVCCFIALEANACLFDGHGCYGRFTNLPWGMLFLHGSAPTLFPVHPTPLYITISHLILLTLLVYLHINGKLKGQLIAILLIGTSIFNVLIEIVKDKQTLVGNFNFAQLLYMTIGLIGLLIFIYQSRQTKLSS